MNWTKNLSKIRLPRYGQRRETRYWHTLEDWANRDRDRDGNGNDNSPDYADALEDVRLSAVVMACVGFVAKMLPRCPWTLEQRVDGAWEPVDAHPILDLLANPTPWHGGPEMLSALICDYLITGTAYWQRVATVETGPPQELWWRPSWSLCPQLNAERTGLKGFVYEVDSRTDEWKPEDVVQVRNVQHGQNPVKSLARHLSAVSAGPGGMDQSRGDTNDGGAVEKPRAGRSRGDPERGSHAIHAGGRRRGAQEISAGGL